MKRLIFVLVYMVILSVSAAAANKIHVVKPKDTLWSLSRSYYKDPFLWGKIWMNNTYLNDPNLIFPGEVIRYTKYGITIYRKPAKQPKMKTSTGELYDSFAFYENNRYYSDCGGGFCVWRKSSFRLAKIYFDKYNNIEVQPGSRVYIKTKKEVNTKWFYIYRPIINHQDSSICPGEPPVMLAPIGVIKVTKRIKPTLFEGVVYKSYAAISQDDIVNCVYPYKTINRQPKPVHLGNIPVKVEVVYGSGLTPHVGYYMFLRAQKPSWKIVKTENGSKVIRFPQKGMENIVGRVVYLDRVNKNLPVNTNIGKGVVVSQYKNLLVVFFDSFHSKLKEIPDLTKKYVLR